MKAGRASNHRLDVAADARWGDRVAGFQVDVTFCKRVPSNFHATLPLILTFSRRERIPRTLCAPCALEPREAPSPGLRPPSPPVGTAIELRRNGFFPILIVILLLISKNLSRARLRLGLRLRACQCGPAAGLNSMAVHPGPLPHPGENVPNFVRALRP